MYGRKPTEIIAIKSEVPKERQGKVYGQVKKKRMVIRRRTEDGPRGVLGN